MKKRFPSNKLFALFQPALLPHPSLLKKTAMGKFSAGKRGLSLSDSLSLAAPGRKRFGWRKEREGRTISGTRVFLTFFYLPVPENSIRADQKFPPRLHLGVESKATPGEVG